MLRRRGITPYIPLHPNQEVTGNAALVTGEFVFHGDHVTCRQGKVLAVGGFPNKALTKIRFWRRLAEKMRRSHQANDEISSPIAIAVPLTQLSIPADLPS
jgi:hypothetical protein